MSRAALKTVPREAIVAAFHAWLAATGKTLTKDGETLAADAIEELVEVKAQLFEDWWLRNFYRYKKMRELDRAPARNAARAFIAQFQLGKIEVEA